MCLQLLPFPTLKHTDPRRETRAWAYRKRRTMQEVELVRGLGLAMEAYSDAYRQRHGRNPVLQNQAVSQTFVKDLIRKIGIEQTCKIMRQYLQMNGDKDWFVNQGHSIAVLQKNIEAVNARLGMQEKKAAPSDYNPMVVFETGCPKCNEQHSVTCRASEMGDHAYTKVCKKCIALHLHIVPL